MTVIARAYAVMPFVWSIGTIIGPAIGGLLAKPADSYPSLFSANGLFGKFPYLLPNLVCSFLLLLSIAGSWLFLQETHPGLQHQNAAGNLDHTSAESPLLATAGATANAGVDLRAESYGTFNQVRLQADEDWFVNADGSKYKTQKTTCFHLPSCLAHHCVIHLYLSLHDVRSSLAYFLAG